MRQRLSPLFTSFAALIFAHATARAEGHLAATDLERFRIPAPLEDEGEQTEIPVFGRDAGHEGTDGTLRVMEWVAKRTWHVLGLPYERKDFTGPPSMSAALRDGWLEIEGTVVDGGVPLRNQVISFEAEQGNPPVLVLLRSTDAFGELLLELDLRRGTARALSVTVSRSMVGGRSHSSPMPEESSARTIATAAFDPIPSGLTKLRIRALGPAISVRAGDDEIFGFGDPDPAGGKIGIGSVGRVRVRDIRQWELVTPREEARRQACIADMEAFAKRIDGYYEGDVRARNQVERLGDDLLWTWPATGATARFRIEGPRVRATVRSGLYGDPVLADGPFPEIVALARGAEYRADPERRAVLEGDASSIRMALPLKSPGGGVAMARVLVRLTVQTVWFWTVTIDLQETGVEPSAIRASLALAQPFGVGPADGTPDPDCGLVPLKARSVLRHDARSGIFIKAIEPERTCLGTAPGGGDALGVAGSGARLRFATVVLPAQPLHLTGFKHRMVHFIRYPEGSVQHWRRGPSPEVYPTDVDLARYASRGADALVWHHTWTSSDFRDREGFLVNDAEMRRAMAETRRLGLKTICYLGIVPGRSSLLRFEDTCSLAGGGTYGGYGKNWDLQDQTFYHVAGRYPAFIAWMADYWARTYRIDGFYLDGGALGLASRGAPQASGREEGAKALGADPEGAGRGGPDLCVDELVHRSYYRVRKVLELNGAGYGFEPWSGLDWMLNGFYDCMMIGESFQEAPPEYYRDGHNALLTGCAIKMYGMRASSQNPYNIAMAAVNLSDIQVTSGNGAWGDDPDTTETWSRVAPLWGLLDSIDWDHLVEARPWYAQELVSGEGFYAGNYTEPRRALVFLANRTEIPGTFDVRIDPARLPGGVRGWRARFVLGRRGDIGPLGDGPLRLDLPALHDGPIGIELLPETSALRIPSPPPSGTGADPKAAAQGGGASLHPVEGFRPSVEGKKLLHFGGPVEGRDDVAFDGVIVGGALPFSRKLDAAELDRSAEVTAGKDFRRHTDNFYLAYSYPGKDAEAFDWFDDLSWVAENWRAMAAAARRARFAGICFDSEYYEGLPLFGYHRMRHASTRIPEEYAAEVRRSGAEIMRAVNEAFPDITILVLFGFSGSHSGVPQHPVSSRKNYTLVAPFVDGLLSECGPRARVFDMHEQSFSFRVPGSFARARALMADVLADRSVDPDRYRRHHRVGFSFWADCWGDASKGRPFDVEDLERNYYAPTEMAYAIHHALAQSDGYVWMWPGAIDWWRGSVKTLDAAGSEVERPLPQAYLEALRAAHRPEVAAPPRDRKPNSYRVVLARTQEGWSDAATFADLWKKYTPIADLPAAWRFRTDPEEVGEERGWHLPSADDRDWAEIRIREFWEPQGYSPYDGAAWYRLEYTPPELPSGRRAFLAFGGVSDEAAVFVDGILLHATRYGENMRHERLLVDVTDALAPGEGSTIVVRVWNTGWCGGIWKGVKLLARR